MSKHEITLIEVGSVEYDVTITEDGDIIQGLAIGGDTQDVYLWCNTCSELVYTPSEHGVSDDWDLL